MVTDNSEFMICEDTEKKQNKCTLTKSDLVKWSCDHLNKLSLCNILVQYICLDRLSKNHEFANESASSDCAVLKWIKFKFAPLDTPQHDLNNTNLAESDCYIYSTRWNVIISVFH
jgi:hypothetical protein